MFPGGPQVPCRRRDGLARLARHEGEGIQTSAARVVPQFEILRVDRINLVLAYA